MLLPFLTSFHFPFLLPSFVPYLICSFPFPSVLFSFFPFSFLHPSLTPSFLPCFPTSSRLFFSRHIQGYSSDSSCLAFLPLIGVRPKPLNPFPLGLARRQRGRLSQTPGKAPLIHPMLLNWNFYISERNSWLNKISCSIVREAPA